MTTGYLILENGSIFQGKIFGYDNFETNYGELVFQTGMVGYVESMTDPSYKNQMLVLTYPLIGNYGVPSSEIDNNNIKLFYESDKISISSLIVSKYENKPSHWQCNKDINTWMKESGVPGLYDIDTRQLVKEIRSHGTLKAVITKDLDTNYNFDNFGMDNLVEQVSTKTITSYYNENYTESNNKVLVIDCGIKNNQLRIFLSRKASITRIPWDYDFVKDYEDGKLKFNKIFISNGPGDPKELEPLIQRIRYIMDKYPEIPMFGICEGHQVISLATGFNTYKMHYGNRGHNIPSLLVGTNICYTTTQNHSYAVDTSKMIKGWKELFKNLNDGSNEGLIHETRPYFTCQFHPEANAGPLDSIFLFDVFLNNELDKLRRIIKNYKISDIKKRKKVLIVGSGPTGIGQSGEFDYSGSQAIKGYKEEGLITVLINPNIATVQTSPGFADKTYLLPITPEFVKKIIKLERPDCIALSFGGQTALNCGVELYKEGIFEEYGIEVLGTEIDNIIKTEDREIFKKILSEVGESVPEGCMTDNYDEAIEIVEKIGYPVLIRSAFALGGLGSGFANNREELEQLLNIVFSNANQVAIDKSLEGWKEFEYEILRDVNNNCVNPCAMENLDPLGVHTGESIVVAPTQTLSNKEHNMLRSAAIKIIRHLNIVGECNIQFTLDPKSDKYYVIEVNARLSRSSALASKATGLPLAYIASKLSLGYSLTDLKNSITKTTSACFEPSLDYVVVKTPKWDLEKFPLVNDEIDSAMKSIGEAMGIGRSFEEAFQKSLRMANGIGFEPDNKYIRDKDVIEELKTPKYFRMYCIANALYYNKLTLDEIYEMTMIDKWYLNKLKNIIDMRKELEENSSLFKNSITNSDLLLSAKKIGFSDLEISKCVKLTENAIRNIRERLNIHPFVKQIDTVSGEFPCYTNYLYVTYNASYHDINFNSNEYVVVLGSGPYNIGSSVEFDWCCVNCIQELKRKGKKVIVINCNPETVSTDYDEADRLYFDELTFETVMDIYNLENPEGIVLSMGGQIPNNIAMALHRRKARILGTSPEMIDNAENRHKFSRMLDNIHVNQPEWRELTSIEDAKVFCNNIGYPCLARPSYVLSGKFMTVLYSDDDLEDYLDISKIVSKDYPIVISKYKLDAKEVDVDAVAMNGNLVVMAISEHIENAGVHSGDSTLVLPSYDLTKVTKDKIRKYTLSIAKALNINGPFNIQFIAKDNMVEVIECNLRVSRSFPFVSKTLGYNFISLATRIIIGDNNIDDIKLNKDKVGIKVSKFSFNRLKGADTLLGVDMLSTGEVACFDNNHYTAFLKGLLSVGFKIPNKKVLVSIGSYKFKNEFLDFVRILEKLGYCLIGTSGTSDFFRSHGVKIEELPLYSNHGKNNILHLLKTHQIDLVINISQRNKIRPDDINTSGYKIRRLSIENSIPVITDIKKAKLLVLSLDKYFNDGKDIKVNPIIDCLTSSKIIRLPGLIDVHTHVREPGKSYKEDWSSITKCALAGGVTGICVMPNTDPAIVDEKTFDYVKSIAERKAHCDYAIYVGANSSNYNSINKISSRAAALKMYLNNTYGTLLLENAGDWVEHIKNWTYDTPLCTHAESKALPGILHLANIYNKKIHICHVARKEEIEIIRDSKKAGMDITCEVAPHHLFMNGCDRHDLGDLSTVKPPIMESEDVKALWDNMDIIDIFATDHAPHTVEDKKKTGCPGFPGLETALPLLLTAVQQGRLTLDDIILRYHTNPIKIFNLPKQENTYIEVDLDKKWVIPDKMTFSKCGWTPFVGKEVYGMVKRVVIRGHVVYVDGEILAEDGFGLDMRQIKKINSNNIENTVNENIIKEEIYCGDKDIKSSMVDFKLGLKNSLSNLRLSFNDSNDRVRLNNIISVDQIDLRDKNIIKKLCNRASYFKVLLNDNSPDSRLKLMGILKGKVLAVVILEESTRTKYSFISAMKRAGGEVLDFSADSSSLGKGESIIDTLKTFEAISDAIVLRTPKYKEINEIQNSINIPLINAGDGVGEHPTQALLDIHTIREERGTLNNLIITMVGDLKNGRTVHSLAKILCLYKVRLRFVSPESLRMPKKVLDYISSHGIEYEEYESIHDVLEKTDVLYVTRIQRERFDDIEEYKKYKNYYQINPHILTKTKPNLVIMHPLPRLNEISPDVDDDPRAAYFRQVENGMCMRMAILEAILG